MFHFPHSFFGLKKHLSALDNREVYYNQNNYKQIIDGTKIIKIINICK